MRTPRRKRTLLSLGGITACVLIFLFLIPVVPVSASISIPYNLEPGSSACSSIISTPEDQLNTTLQAEVQACLASYLYPPVPVSGRTTISYSVLGLGPSPYPREELVAQGNQTALVYFKGASIEAAESFRAPITSLNPSGVVRIDNDSLFFGPSDLLEFSATVTNVSRESMTVGVRIWGTGPFGGNTTSGGVTWIGAGPVSCTPNLAPGSHCNVSSQALGNVDTKVTQLRFTVEAFGELDGSWFLYQQRFTMSNPSTGQPGAQWVAVFMKAVNGARNGTALEEDKTLDSFAQLRFNTSVSNYTIANYGFNSDVESFFASGGVQTGEATLFPGAYLPAQYASVVQQTAPGHWSILTDPAYTKFGYFVGEGPTVVAQEPCSVTEFPAAGANMTQYLTEHGCGYDVVQGPWVVIEVES
jgi:hypothetical protein